MRVTASCVAAALSFALGATLQANTYGSVEPVANPAVIDTRSLSDQPLRVREAFATRLLQSGIVNRVVEALTSTGAITTINDLNTHFAVGAGGFAGRTNPSFVYTVIDNGPNAASAGDVKVLTDSLGYVLSLAGYVRAAAAFGVEYTPIVNGVPSLLQGGAAFPGNDWTLNPRGEEYLSRIPAQSHRALGRIRAFHLRTTREALRKLESHDKRWQDDVASFACQ
jgi:hypothetical protein